MPPALDAWGQRPVRPPLHTTHRNCNHRSVLDEASVLTPIALADVLLLFYFQNPRSSCKKQNLKEPVHHGGLGQFLLEGLYDLIHDVIVCKSYVLVDSQGFRLFFLVVDNALIQMHIQLMARSKY